MQTVLVVVRPFAGWAVGDVIDDPQQMRTLLAGEYAMALVRVPRRSEGVEAALPADGDAAVKPNERAEG